MPFTVTGVSTSGQQFLGGGSLTSTSRMAILLGTSPALITRRVGYFYVCPYLPGASYPNSILNRGLLNQPGVAFTVDSNVMSVYAGVAVYVTWNIPGISWNLTTF